MTRVLFVCVRNAGRSQMAEALFERAVNGRHEARSAGSAPAGAVHPEVLDAMRELGVELEDRVPRRLEREDAEWADVVVTMGCGDACPYIPWQALRRLGAPRSRRPGVGGGSPDSRRDRRARSLAGGRARRLARPRARSASPDRHDLFSRADSAGVSRMEAGDSARARGKPASDHRRPPRSTAAGVLSGLRGLQAPRVPAPGRGTPRPRSLRRAGRRRRRPRASASRSP